MQYPAISLLPQRPIKVKLDAMKTVARKKFQAQGKGSFIMWLGNLLTMVVQEYHRAFSRKGCFMIGILHGRGVSRDIIINVVLAVKLV